MGGGKQVKSSHRPQLWHACYPIKTSLFPHPSSRLPSEHHRTPQITTHRPFNSASAASKSDEPHGKEVHCYRKNQVKSSYCPQLWYAKHSTSTSFLISSLISHLLSFPLTHHHLLPPLPSLTLNLPLPPPSLTNTPSPIAATSSRLTTPPLPSPTHTPPSPP